MRASGIIHFIFFKRTKNFFGKLICSNKQKYIERNIFICSKYWKERKNFYCKVFEHFGQLIDGIRNVPFVSHDII